MKNQRDHSFSSFHDFYPYYLSQHTKRSTKILHFIGISLLLLLVLLTLYIHLWCLFLVAILQAYFLAWIGHYFFEHNQPATFTHPWYSMLGDWQMWLDIVRGHVSL